MCVGSNDLGPSCAVDVNGGRTFKTHLIRARARNRHEFCGVFCPIDPAVTFVDVFNASYRGERHELGTPQPAVKSLVDLPICRLTQDRPIPEGSRPEFHSALKDADDASAR